MFILTFLFFMFIFCIFVYKKKLMINKINFNNNLNIVVCGDIHGEFDIIFSKINRLLNNTLVIICGDIGMGFHKPQYYVDIFNKYDTKLAEQNNRVVLFRGNHDSPTYFDLSKSHLFEEIKNIKLIPDYTVIENNYLDIKQNILCIGGATSIDRVYRQQKDLEYKIENEKYKSSFIRKSYWEGETVFYDIDKLDFINKNIKLDMVCTHTAPSFVPPMIKNNIQGWLTQDFYLESDLDNERKIMSDIYDKLIEKQDNIKYWCYGHFHTHNSVKINETTFLLSNVDELNEIRL